MAIVARNLRTLAEDIATIRRRMRNDIVFADSGIHPWGLMWLLMVGSLYALHRSQPLLHSALPPRTQMDQARTIPEAIARGASPRERDLSVWMVRYHLNSAEQRVPAALHRIVRIYCGRRRGQAWELVDNIILRGCPHCEGTPSQCYPNAEVILRRGLHDMRGPRTRAFNYSDISEGACIARVWERVNQLKHEPDEIQQPEDPIQRWNDCYNALSGVMQIYRDFLTHLNLLV